MWCVKLLLLIALIATGSGNYGTYSVDEAWEQMAHGSSSSIPSAVAKAGINPRVLIVPV